ncbi:MAG: DUF808 domain-containing protein [Gammaproteobacteria bacterium]|nr:DUF808 domain-containing protein [Gammaproteobacteria bacterium]
MAAANLLALIDDIATLLDDISVYSKIASKKTAGVLGDDLALNAEQVTGIRAERELPVVWAVAKGSFVNKLILVPLALLISAALPWLVILMLMVGGAYLCYEGFEKVFHKLMHFRQADDEHHRQQVAAICDSSIDMVEFEQAKIKGAIRTDFILSAEIIVLTLGTVQEAAFLIQVGVLSAIAIGVTVFVYGLVAGIVKLDDAGLHLIKSAGQGLWSNLQRRIGRIILLSAPYLMKLLSIVGTVAMFLVGGGIIAHHTPLIHHGIETLSISMATLPALGTIISGSVPMLSNLAVGFILGGLVMLFINLFKQLYNRLNVRR